MTGDRREAMEQQVLARVEELSRSLERLEPSAAAPSRELVQLVLDLHAQGLARMLEVIADSDGGASLIERLAVDDQVRGLLVLHDLHPRPLDSRVRETLDRLHPHLAVQGVRVQAVEVVEGAVTVRLNCDGEGERRPAPESLRSELEDAVFDAAPDATGVEILGLPVPEVRVPLASLRAQRPSRAGER